MGWTVSPSSSTSTSARSDEVSDPSPMATSHRPAGGPRAVLERLQRLGPRALGGFAVALVLLVALLWVVLARGSGGGAPAAAATKLVPADALVYVHLSTDTGRDGTKAARDLAQG